MGEIARSRITQILDENSFAELGAFASAKITELNKADQKKASDGIITGYGRIGGRNVYIFSQDPEVLNGSIGEMHASKIERLYELAVNSGSPVIGIFDSAGLRLNEGPDALAALGRICAAVSRASGVILQIAVAAGSCGGGLSVIPQLCDLCFVEKGKGRLFVNSPDAIPESSRSSEDTSKSSFAMENGLADMEGSFEEIAACIRKLTGILPANCQDLQDYGACGDDPNRLCPQISQYRYEPDIYIPMIADNEEIFEVRRGHAKDIMAGFLQINGETCGFIAHRGDAKKAAGALVSPAGMKKAASFIDLCDAFAIPVITFINTDGFERSSAAEKETALAASCVVQAYSNASVPMISVMTGDSYGSAMLFAGSRALGADMVFAWDDVKTGAMKAELAGQVIAAGKGADEIEEAAEEYEALHNSIYTAAAHGLVDMIITPEETRKYLAGALDMLASKGAF